MQHHFSPENSLAFGVQLEGQGSKMEPENGQVVRRSLEVSFEPEPAAFGLAFEVRAALAAKDRHNLLEVQPGTGPINQGFKYLLHLSRTPKQQVARVLHLKQRTTVFETTPQSFAFGQGKMETTVEPAVADLTQLPFGG
jgi:hypothetical protein